MKKLLLLFLICLSSMLFIGCMPTQEDPIAVSIVVTSDPLQSTETAVSATPTSDNIERTTTPLPTQIITPTVEPTVTPSSTPTTVPMPTSVSQAQTNQMDSLAGLRYQIEDEIWQIDNSGLPQRLQTVPQPPIQIGNTADAPIWIERELTGEEDVNQTVKLILHNTLTQEDVILIEEVWDAEVAHPEVLLSNWIILGVTPTKEDINAWNQSHTAVVRLDGSDYFELACESYCPYRHNSVFMDTIAYNDNGQPKLYHLAQGDLNFDPDAWGIGRESYDWLEPTWSPNGRYLAWPATPIIGGEYAKGAIVIIFDMHNKVIYDYPSIPVFGSPHNNPYVRWSDDSQIAYVHDYNSVVHATFFMNLEDSTTRYWYGGIDELSISPDRLWFFIHHYQSLEDQIGHYAIINWENNLEDSIKNEYALGEDVSLIGWCSDAQHAIFTTAQKEQEFIWLELGTWVEERVPFTIEGAFCSPNTNQIIVTQFNPDDNSINYFIATIGEWDFEQLNLPENSEIIDWTSLQ